MAARSREEVPDKSVWDEKVREIREKHLAVLRGRTDDAFILAFLRYRGYDVDKAVAAIDRFYACRKKYPEWMQNRDSTNEQAKKIFKLGFSIPIQTHSKTGIIWIIRHDGYDPRTIPVDALCNLTFGLTESVVFREEEYQTPGIAGLVNVEEVSARIIACFTISNIKKFVEIVFKCYPMYIREVHFVGSSKMFDAILSIALWFLPAKAKKGIYQHGNDFDSLHRYIPPEFLPAEYRGTNGTLKSHAEKIEKFTEELKEYFRSDTYGCN